MFTISFEGYEYSNHKINKFKGLEKVDKNAQKIVTSRTASHKFCSLQIQIAICRHGDNKNDDRSNYSGKQLGGWFNT